MRLSDRRERAFDALSKARRERLPVSAVVPLVRLPADEIIEITRDGWNQAGGDWWPTEWDAISRPMSVLTPESTFPHGTPVPAGPATDQ